VVVVVVCSLCDVVVVVVVVAFGMFRWFLKQKKDLCRSVRVINCKLLLLCGEEQVFKDGML
jgi:hypothetical protein